MKINALTKVRQLFNNPDIPHHHNRAYRRQWVRQIRLLGSHWLLAKPVRRVNIDK